MIPRLRSRHGYVLVAAICLLTLVSILAVAAFGFVGSLQRASRAALRDARLDLAAEELLVTGADTVRVARAAPGWLRVGETREFFPGGWEPLRATASVTRTMPALYWLAVEASDHEGGVRRANLVLRVPEWTDDAVIVAAGDVHVGSGFVVAPGDAGCGDGGSAPLIRVSPGSNLHADSAGAARLEHADEAGDSLYYMHLLGESWSALVARARHRFPHGASIAPAPDGACLDPGAGNWGDPVAPPGTGCGNYRPVIHAAGDFILFGGRGAGLLLVEGRLRITGPVHFAGVIVALAGVTVAADGARLDGTILAGPRATWSSGPVVSLEGLSALHHSRCVVGITAAAVGRPRPVQGRYWAELF